MKSGKREFTIEALFAFGAGLAWITWIGINIATGGALDADPAARPNLVRLGQFLMIAQNLLLLPAVVVLWQWSAKRNFRVASQITLCGIISLVYWSYASASRTNSFTVEAVYLVLSGVWWLGLGLLLRPERRAFGVFTIILGVITLWDGVLSMAGEVPFWLLTTAAPKLILALVWDFWLGIVLLRSGAADSDDE